MNFWPDFIKLKTSVGGNREQYGYEEAFGQPREEQQHITVPARHNRRLLSQLEFAIRLNEVRSGEFDDCLRRTVNYLLRCLELDGVLTRSACRKAEEMLLPMEAAAKEYKLILAGHAHIDMDWMWSYHETVAITLSTFRTVLNLMNQLKKEFNLTYIFVAHDLSVVEHISDRVGVMYLGNFVEVADKKKLYKNPCHPYTQALLSAVPIPDPTAKKERIILEGNIPSALNPPTGCKFHTRCPKCMEICKQKAPEKVEIEPGHEVYCHLYSEQK